MSCILFPLNSVSGENFLLDISYTNTLLEVTFDKYRSVVGPVDTSDEALTRCFINLVVFNCILEERRVIKIARTIPLTVDPSPSALSLPTTPAKSGCQIANVSSVEPTPIALYFETELKQEVVHDGKSYLLSGLADYSLGYQRQGADAGHLVIVEAKRRGQLHSAQPQLLAYMGQFCQQRSVIPKLTSELQV
jgi:hypothetical protein